ncbi:flagellar basal body-associated protein FliL [Clostridium sartagoforme AAU1]|uniref:Flagellar protein FliL n=1 Tax=Clostridium sartagoforme AAU1 TaxID=1202534 RepID=R9CJ79_9CLOT|nr:flagellar basal body-associated FliL family protein [Clostridium sartagoforme]EOR27246.1 flagellar basal body-associated protein FliL [Clostridium sartagoforme AAU1]
MAEEKKEKKKGNKLILIIAILAVLGGGTFGGVYYFMNKDNASQPVVIQEAFFEVGEIFVNLSDEGSKRYIKLNLSISYDSKNKDLAKEIEDKKVVIRDIAIFYIKSCKAKDFEPANEAVLKGDIIARINQKLTSGLLKDIYISDIIVQ